MGQLKNEALLQEIAKELKRLRRIKGVSQEDVFNDTEIHIGRIETGKTNISISTLSALCNYFGLSLSDFFKDIK
jgi:transcriptional regulator with XRE-family HTH domain